MSIVVTQDHSTAVSVDGEITLEFNKAIFCSPSSQVPDDKELL
jgi:hypothetical protein